MNRRKLLSKLLILGLAPWDSFAKKRPFIPELTPKWSELINQYWLGRWSPEQTLELFINSITSKEEAIDQLTRLAKQSNLGKDPLPLVREIGPQGQKAKVQIFKLTPDRPTPPHMHKNLFSCQIVLSGEVEFHQWNRVQLKENSIQYNNGRTNQKGRGGYITSRTEHYNIHAFSSKKTAYILNFNIQEPGKESKFPSFVKTGRHFIKLSQFKKGKAVFTTAQNALKSLAFTKRS